MRYQMLCSGPQPTHSCRRRCGDRAGQLERVSMADRTAADLVRGWPHAMPYALLWPTATHSRFYATATTTASSARTTTASGARWDVDFLL